MKKFALFLAAGLLVAGTAFAQEENAALGFGLMSDSSDTSLVGGGVRGSLHFDAGSKLFGPVYYGFELQGDLKKMSETSSAFSTTDVSAYFFNNATIIQIQQNNYKETYTLWDIDVSPRGYLSFDVGEKVQVLGFAGLNYNWQSLEYKIKNRNGGAVALNAGGDGISNEITKNTDFAGNWSALMGFRVTLGVFYVDYTRFLQANDTGDYAWNQYNKDRLGAGLNLRF